MTYTTLNNKNFSDFKRDKSKVILFTGKGCRACARFSKKYIEISSNKCDKIPFYLIEFNDENWDPSTRKDVFEIAKVYDIKTLPTLIIQGPDVKSYSAVPGNYDDIVKDIEGVKILDI